MRRTVAILVFCLASVLAAAAEIDVTVKDVSGKTVSDAVVWAIPANGTVPPPKTEAVMDQKNRMFIPHVLAIQTGTAVRFPNSDNVRHQVYSFSAPKRFQLPLYEGSPAEPVVFDKPGIVALGCNIHDRMSAFIVVVDTPWFGVTSDGRTTLKDLASGRYAIRVWTQTLRGEPPAQSIEIQREERRELTITVGGK